MDLNEVLEFLDKLNWLWSFVGGIIAYFITKKIDVGLGSKSKKDEEIREIKRKRYEEFIEAIESILSRKGGLSEDEYFREWNLVYAKAYITIPDSILKSIKKETGGFFDANSRKSIYLEIRKDMIGKTNLQEDDLCYFAKAEDK